MKRLKHVVPILAVFTSVQCHDGSKSELKDTIPVAERYNNDACASLDIDKYQSAGDPEVDPNSDAIKNHRKVDEGSDGLCGTELTAIQDALSFRQGDFVKTADSYLNTADTTLSRVEPLLANLDSINASLQDAIARNGAPAEIEKLQTQKTAVIKQIESLKSAARSYYKLVASPINLILGPYKLKDGTGVVLGKWEDCSYKQLNSIEGPGANNYSTKDLAQTVGYRACEAVTLVNVLQTMSESQNRIYGFTKNQRFATNSDVFGKLARDVKSTLFSYSEKAQQRIDMLNNGSLDGIRFQDISILATLGEPTYFIDKMEQSLNRIDSRYDTLKNHFVARDTAVDSETELAARMVSLRNELDDYSVTGPTHVAKKKNLDDAAKSLDKKIDDANTEKNNVLNYVGKSFKERFVGVNDSLQFPQELLTIEPYSDGLSDGAQDIVDLSDMSAIEIEAPGTTRIRANGIYYHIEEDLKAAEKKIADLKLLLGGTTYMLNRSRTIHDSAIGKDKGSCRQVSRIVCAKPADRGNYVTSIQGSELFQQEIREAFKNVTDGGTFAEAIITGNHDYLKGRQLSAIETYLSQRVNTLTAELEIMRNGNGNASWAQVYMQDTDLSGYRVNISSSTATNQGTSLSASSNMISMSSSMGTSTSTGSAISRGIYSTKAVYPQFPVGSLVGVMQETCGGSVNLTPNYIGLQAYILVPQKAGCSYKMGFLVNDQNSIKLENGTTVTPDAVECSIFQNASESKMCSMISAPISLRIVKYKSAQKEFATAIGVLESLQLSNTMFATISSNENPIRLGVEYVRGELRKNGINNADILTSIEPIVEAMISQKLMEAKIVDLEDQKRRLQNDILDENLAATLAENRNNANGKIASLLNSSEKTRAGLRAGYQELVNQDIAALDAQIGQVLQWKTPLLKALKYHQSISSDKLNELRKQFEDLETKYLTSRRKVLQVNSFSSLADFQSELDKFQSSVTNLRNLSQLKWIVNQNVVGHCELVIDPKKLFASPVNKNSPNFDGRVIETIRSNSVNYDSYYSIPFSTVLDSNGGALDCQQKLNNATTAPKILALTVEWNEAVTDGGDVPPIGMNPSADSSASNKTLLDKGLSEVYLKRENRMWWKGKFSSQYYLLSEDDFDEWVKASLDLPIYNFIRSVNSYHSAAYEDLSCKVGSLKNLAQVGCIKKLSGDLYDVSSDALIRNPYAIQTLFANTLIESDWNLIVPNKQLGDLGAAADQLKVHVFYYNTNLK